LVRLGLSHFKREYLLGREIDTLNLKSIGSAFSRRFTGTAKSVGEWYRKEIPITLKQLRQPLLIVTGLAVVALVVSYMWVVVNVPVYVDLSPERIEGIKTFVADNLTNLDELQTTLPAPLLFFHNARTTVIILLLGLVSFSTVGLTLFIVNIALVGGVLGAVSLVGYSPLAVFAIGILPHGIFELTAVFLSTAAMLKAGALLVTPQPDKSLGEIFLFSVADWSRVFVGLVIPLLTIAALVEIYITPILIKIALPYL